MKTRGHFLLLLATALMLGAGLWRLFDLRFATGDVYPPGSTLRATAAGTRAYFESLSRIPGRTVSRGLLPLSSLRGGPSTTLFLLAVDPAGAWVRPRDRETLRNLLANGTRVVVAFRPTAEFSENRTNTSFLARKENHELQTLSAALDLPALAPIQGSGAKVAVRTEAAPASLPAKIPWRDTAFEAPTNAWLILYSVDEAPILLEQASGHGTLVLLANSELLTNDALRHERQPALLAWLAGSATQLIFNETHLGTRLDPGIMTLVRRYGLTGVLLAILVVAGLALWRNASSLEPRRIAPPDGGMEVVLGRDATAGFTQLLKRSVAPCELLPLCLAEWRRTLPRDRLDLLRKAASLQDAVNLEAAQPVRAQNPARTYQRVVELLSRP